MSTAWALIALAAFLIFFGLWLGLTARTRSRIVFGMLIIFGGLVANFGAAVLSQ